MIFRTCKSGKPKSHVRHVKPVFMRVYKNLRTCRTSRTLPFYLTAFLTDRQEVEAQRLREEYGNDRVVQAIRKLVEQGGGIWEGTASDIVEASRYFRSGQITDDVAKIGKKIRKYTQQLIDFDAIIFTCKVTNRTSEYCFRSKNPFTTSTTSTTTPTSTTSTTIEHD